MTKAGEEINSLLHTKDTRTKKMHPNKAHAPDPVRKKAI